jgi:dUTP pyrophosphatase
MDLTVEIKKVSSLVGNQIPWPQYATDGSAGLDLRACLDEALTLLPGQTQIVPSGIAISIGSPSYMAVVLPRSGLGNEGVILANTVGVIDSDYQGEIKISIWNRTDDKTFVIEPGQRICQLIFVPIQKVAFKPVDDFTTATKRGTGGFGHTGKC